MNGRAGVKLVLKKQTVRHCSRRHFLEQHVEVYSCKTVNGLK